MRNTNEKIEEIKQHGYDLDFGTVFNHAFECYKKIALNAGAAFLILSILLGIVCFAVVFGLIGIGFSIENMKEFDITSFTIIGIIVYAVMIILISCLVSPFNAGLLKMAQNASKNEEISLGISFSYYSSSYFMDIVLTTFVLSVFTTISAVGLELVGYKILGTFVNLCISFMTFLAIPFVIFGGLKPMEAIQASITIVSKQFFIILGLLIVSGLFSALGIFAFCIGIFFTIPFLNAMTYSIYATIMNDDEEEIETADNSENEVVPE